MLTILSMSIQFFFGQLCPQQIEVAHDPIILFYASRFIFCVKYFIGYTWALAMDG